MRRRAFARTTEDQKAQSFWTQVRGWRIHARRSELALSPHDGADAVVLVHGLGMSHRYMMPTLRRLAPHTSVYALDLPGFGKSDRPPCALDVDELADALADWLAANNLQDAVLVGNSFGCQIIVEAVARRLVSPPALVLIAPTVDAQRRTIRQQLTRLLLDAPREPLSLTPLAIREYLFTVGFFRALATLRFALADAVEDKLPRVSAPTLVVRGGRDPLVPQSWAETVTKMLPNARLVVLPRAAHAVNYNAPAALAREILRFLRELPATNN